jgi:putative component of membrane protein insertase Oxa1/YidC/SpoIIIJ protein YidD
MFHPSCSEYAKQALAEHGAVVGFLLAVDRYLRCNGVDRDLYPYDPILRKLLDPVPEKKTKQASK